ncbi:Crp/Fnr family transcriptional regulator [Fodinibius halophilus]|uniref:Crp/Fnr family transcriptional regulator n=1 Tax=Fodinibius halophilus TaxID=1736908 RepID=A0A6M1T0X0_9BACT|nr:Crp/Fnr family transcriptional regulator [Fodinibius halophilus]NGP87579.1 Crp/Fnr family transcriptional regulator [Fodinibius halophilus]
MADRIHNLSEFIQQDKAQDHFQQVEQVFKKRKYAAGDMLICNREVCTELFYLEEGLVRCSNFEDNRTLWFEIANNFFTVPDSFMHQSPSHQEITCLEDSTIYTLKREKLQQLCNSDNNWANWWIEVLEREYLKLEYIYQTLIYKSASERYHELISAIPNIENRIPLKYISSFLGISQVSLSRIRAGKQ